MKRRLAFILWYLFFVYRFFIICCVTVATMHTYSVTNIDNQNYNSTNIENLKNDSRSSDNVTYIYENEIESDLDDFGLDLLEYLPIEFPIAFQVDEDVNLTLENEHLLEIIDQSKNAEMYRKDLNVEDIYEEQEKDIFIDMVDHFAQYLKKSGKRALKSLAYDVKNLKKIVHEIDQQLIILDMLESYLKIFREASEEMCGAIVKEVNNSLSVNQTNSIEKAIGSANYHERKETFNYICKKTYVCRPFPAFSDYISKLLKTILKLEENYFNTVVEIIDDVVREKADFFHSVIEDNMVRNVTLNLESLADDPNKVSSLMTLAVRTIVKRFKVFYMNGVEVRNSTKAARILIDIIDVTFQVLEENVLSADVLDLIKDITFLSNRKKRDVENKLSDFLFEAIHFLEMYWIQDIREEVRVLIEIMMTGTSNNDVLSDQLFTKGSKIGTDEHVL